MESPQLENGYTRIANEILDRTMKARFSGTQKDIVLAIWRYTYGFGRKEHGLSIDFLAEATDTHPKLVKRNIDSLVKRNIIQITLGAAGTRSRKIAFNKNYEQWKDPPDKSLEGAKQGSLVNRRNTTKKNQIAPPNGTKLLPLEGAKQPPKKEKRKSLKKEEIYIENLSEKIKFLDTVFLTQSEHDRLIEAFGKEMVELYIEKLDEWQTNYPKKQKVDHNKTIRVWIKNDAAKKKQYGNKQLSQNEKLMQEIKEDSKHEQGGGKKALLDHQ